MATTADIQAWLSAHPGATDAEIAAAMQAAGVTTQQMAEATGADLGSIQQRYDAAIGGATSTPTTSTLSADQASALKTRIDQQWGGYFDENGQSQTGSLFDANGVYNPTANRTAGSTADDRNFGVIALATQKGISSADLAGVLGIPQSTITNYLQNYYQNTDPTAANYTSAATGASLASHLDAGNIITQAGGAAGMYGDDPTTYTRSRLGSTDYSSLGYISPDSQSRYQDAVQNGWYNPQTDSRYAIFGGGGSGVTGYQSVLNPYAQLPSYLSDSTSYQPSAQQINEWRAAHPDASYQDTIAAMRSGAVDGQAATAGTTGATSGASATPTFTNQQIQAWFAANPGATDLQIAQAMQQFHITPQQLSGAISVPVDQITARFNAALGTGGTGSGGSGGGTGINDPAYRGSGGSGWIDNFGGSGGTGGTGGTTGGLGGLGGSPAGFNGGFNVNLGPVPTLQAVGNQPNPYLAQQADEITRRSGLALQDSFNGIRSNAVGVGGLGGSRQGVAEGVATGRAMDSLQGQLANLYGTAYESDSNRALQKYAQDSGNYNAKLSYDLGLGGLSNQRYGMDQQFYTQQRGQDQAGAALGASLYGLGTQGQWAPLNNASNVYNQYTGFGTGSTSTSGGGGLTGALGGALAGGQIARNLGLTGSTSDMPMINGGGFSNFPAYMLQN